MSARPLLRWAGGKTQLLPELLNLAPKEFNVYHEPFVGGGALFFALNPKQARLSDLNSKLINVYRCVQNNVQEVIDHLRTFQKTSECFYEQRRLMNENTLSSPQDALGAARFIFLNKLCFNGLYRENASGGFNVPYAGNRNVTFLDEANLLECSIVLQKVELYTQGFECVADRVVPGDFVYFDPPYVPVNATSFVDYTADGFGANEQLQLRDLARALKKDGVNVMLSNSDAPLVRELYADGFELHEVQARRSINRNGKNRGKVGELIIR